MITILRFVLVPAVVYWPADRRNGAGLLRAFSSPAFPTASTASSPATSTSAPSSAPISTRWPTSCFWSRVFVVLGFIGELPLWLVIAVVSRDALIVCAVLLSTVMGNPVEMKPLLVSKANTAVQIVLAAVVLAELAFATDLGPTAAGAHNPVRAS